MKRVLGFVEKAEAAGNPVELATVRSELSTAQARIADLEAQLVTAQAAQATFEVTINDLNATVQSLETKSKSLEAELANAKTEAARILAGQSLPPENLPPASNAGASQTVQQLIADLNKIAPTDGRARAEFIEKHKDALRKASR